MNSFAILVSSDPVNGVSLIPAKLLQILAALRVLIV